MTRVLKLAQLAQDDRVAEVNVRRRRVDPQLHAKRPVLRARRLELLRQRSPGKAVHGVDSQGGSLLGGLLRGRIGAFGHQRSMLDSRPPGVDRALGEAVPRSSRPAPSE